MRRLLTLGLALAVVVGSPLAAFPTARAATTPTLAQLIGQKLMVAMSGLTPSADLLGRIKRGEVGGVILFGSNISSPRRNRGVSHWWGTRRVPYLSRRAHGERSLDRRA